MIELFSTSLDDTIALGRRLGELAQRGDVFALDGELGAGKTQLVRGLAQGLGLDPAHVSSPTFVFMHEYPPEDEHGHPIEDNPDRPTLIHIDAYRVTSAHDLATLGYEDELRDTSVTAVEWATLLAAAPGQPLGNHRLHLQIEHQDHNHRRLTLTPHGRWQDQLPHLQNLAPGKFPGAATTNPSSHPQPTA
ncbi:MAG: tRNA (adenosine(37)-N6)-threonylcarbamoyltransferase complex ATPase subunit type 1 TsaE [Planctomycetota bacterium]